MTKEDENQIANRIRASSATMPYRPDWIAKVSAGTLRTDAVAGVTGATLVLPQGVAFAAIAGLPSEYGFYTAIIPADRSCDAQVEWARGIAFDRNRIWDDPRRRPGGQAGHAEPSISDGIG